jgi:hypothetical protein
MKTKSSTLNPHLLTLSLQPRPPHNTGRMDDSSDESVIMEQEKPAGFFSTFSIADPDGSTREGLGRTQRRNRRVFVCIPCHRRKLKCDKAQPCSRCVASGAPGECVYQQAPGQRQEPGGELEAGARSEAGATRQASPEAPRAGPRVRLEGVTGEALLVRLVSSLAVLCGCAA